MIREAVAGDTGDTRVWELSGVDTLAGAVSVAVYFQRNGTKIAVAGTIEDAAERTIRVPLGPFLNDADITPGDWQVEVAIDEGLSGELSWPSPVTDQIQVRQPIS